MRYVECPASLDEHLKHYPMLFLAGGITDCPDWQKDAVTMLADEGVTLLNPRRSSYQTDQPNIAVQQIEWEHAHLDVADGILFWFPEEAICPIALYELGAWSKTKKPIFVGVHHRYRRKLDVQVQTRLARPEVSVHYNLSSLVGNVKLWLASLRAKQDA